MALLHCCYTNTPITLSSSSSSMNAKFSCLFKSSLNPTKFSENTLINLLFIFPETFMGEGAELLPLSRTESVWERLWQVRGSKLSRHQWCVLSAHTANSTQPAVSFFDQSQACQRFYSNNLFFQFA